MTGQPNRLPQGQHHLNGRLIDRGKPLRFRLDGAWIDGLTGDTVLSAALAAGVTSAGLHEGAPLALDERFAPAIVPAAMAGDPEQALPMARTPATNGADYRSLGVARPTRMARWLKPRLRNGRLPQAYDRMLLNAEPWTQLPAGEPVPVDLVVVGGGVAGLSAALAAGESGASVVVIERRQDFGGDARLFGAIEGEEAPDAMIERLITALSQLENVTLLTRTEALSVGGGIVRAHRVEIDGKSVSGRVVAYAARRVILATGCAERLPVFAGNRLPGVVGLAAAFARADAFGIAIGSSFAINTSVSHGYRYAMLASDAGLTLSRMSDTRAGPSSRFIEFSKAYGMPLTSALVPVAATRNTGKGPALAITLASTMPGVEASATPIFADQFVVAGGWQPDLSLWLGAGGAARWAPEVNALVADGRLSGIALAGAVAGYRSLSGCARSGAAAVAFLFKRRVVVVRDIEIDSFYETPDGPTGMAPAAAAAAGPAYLDGGWSLATRAATESQSLAAAQRALGLGDVAAGVQLGLLPAEAAGMVAGERAVPAVAIGGNGSAGPPSAPKPALYPDYMIGRFGEKAELWSVRADDARRLQVGALLSTGADTAAPEAAIGAVVSSSKEGDAVALVAAAEARPGAVLTLRDGTQQVAVRLKEKRG
jgi:sarcosine oxidase subunit alpha